MPKVKDGSPLLAAAAELEDELEAFAELAVEAKRHALSNEKSLSRAARALTSSVDHQARIEVKLRALVMEIEKAREKQQTSVTALMEVARDLEARTKKRDELLSRFAALGASATHVNALTIELATRKTEGAPDQEILERLAEIQLQMAGVAAEAETLATAAQHDGWTEIARQADGVKQQIHAAKNKLAIAQRDIAARAPS
jgi:chromosome segregation ATPase